MYEATLRSHPSRWAHVEAPFLIAMREFDELLRAGRANQGDNQNGKGDFFTDLIALLLENCSGKSLRGRGRVPGLIFANHALDASYPSSGEVEVLIETKAAGAPKTGRNPRQTNPKGRDGSADLDKRIKEAALKTIDLKAEWARRAGKGGGPSGDLITWLKASRPKCFLFLAIRVVDERDFDRTVRFADAANQLMDGVGLVAYDPDTKKGTYAVRKTPTHLDLDRVMTRVCTLLKTLS